MNYLKTVNKIFDFYNIIRNAIIITLCIIIVDYLNIPSISMENNLFLTSIIFLALIILITIDLIRSKKHKLIKSESINILDRNIFIFLIAVLIYGIYLLSDFKTYKIIVLSISLVALLFTIIWRITYLSKKFKKNKEASVSNICDLKEFLDGKISANDSNKIILFEEKDVEYDLLNRGIFVNHITSLINYCNPEKSFVFSLNGPWGSGKSTVLNLVKKSINTEDIIVIDDFDPWRYNDNQTLFRGFFDSITKNENFAFDYSLYKKLYNVYKVLILGNDSILDKINFDVHFTDESYSIDELKNIISTYLKMNNKKVVFIIDNIDRLNKEQILVIFKTVSTLFDFDNFVYLLSFDEERISKIFEDELKIDANYLNKIINSNIYLPKVNHEKVVDIAVDTINKMYEYYNIEISEEEKEKFIDVFIDLAWNFEDIRELKRFFNYISAYMQSTDMQEQINMGDFINIQLLKFLNIGLYNEIYNNSQYFVYRDMQFVYTLIESSFNEQYNNLAKEFYENLFKDSNNAKYENALARLFPYTYNYLQTDKVISEEQKFIEKEQYTEGIVNKRIFSNRYFEHYFELTPNEYSEMLKDVNVFIDKFNNAKDIEEMKMYYKANIASNTSSQSIKLEMLEKLLHKINKEKIIFLINIIYNDFNESKNNGDKLNNTNIRHRGMREIAELFNMLEINIAKKEIQKFVNKMNNWLDESLLIRYLNPEENEQKDLNKEIYDFTRNIFMNEMNNILDNKIDILSNKQHQKYTIVAFEIFYVNQDKLREYIYSILNKDNIFRFLHNHIYQLKGIKGFRYEFNEERLTRLIPRGDIDEIIASVNYKLNIDQQRVKDIYYKKVEEDYYFSTPIEYKNL